MHVWLLMERPDLGSISMRGRYSRMGSGGGKEGKRLNSHEWGEEQNGGCQSPNFGSACRASLSNDHSRQVVSV